jgi:glycerophosphoryl diester phosphodiesterase
LPPLIIAHRGDSALRPENTLASFASALEVGADIVELDVQLTRDGHAIVIHDPSVERTTNGKGRVAELTLQELRSLSAGYASRFGDAFRGERLPTLGEALAFLKGRARVLIEIKPESVSDDAAGGVEALCIEAVRRAEMASEVALISFDARALLRCRELAPELKRGHLFYRASPDELVAGARAVECDLVMPEKGMLSDGLVRRLREARLNVATWVVDDPEELRALLRYELFAVASNRPGVLLEETLETE